VLSGLFVQALVDAIVDKGIGTARQDIGARQSHVPHGTCEEESEKEEEVRENYEQAVEVFPPDSERSKYGARWCINRNNFLI